MRAIFEHIYGEPMHPTWKLRRHCSTPHCANPAHWRCEFALRLGVELRPVPLPRAQIEMDQPDTVDDVIDSILIRGRPRPHA